jgi:hypothetical protein
VTPVQHIPWGAREFVIRDDQVRTTTIGGLA